MSKSRKRRKDKNKSKHKHSGPPIADSADRHELYEQSVQSVDTEIEFLDKTFRTVRGRQALSLREDFCGTASAACEWVKSDAARTAVGVDLDAAVLDWGRRNRLARLPEDAQQRISLMEADVLAANTDPVDLAVAFNFSYFTFKDRGTLRAYFRGVREHLKHDGLFLLDCFGGSEAHEEMEEVTEHDGFDYVWDQDKHDPITGEMTCHIHFRFPDGSSLEPAFSYDWRLWSLPEIRELLTEAGFSRSTVYWQEEDDEDEGDGEFFPAEHGEADPAWIAYVVAEK
jgi:SAM-dependent methyltransferase